MTAAGNAYFFNFFIKLGRFKLDPFLQGNKIANMKIKKGCQIELVLGGLLI